jgi:hypothetical protein
VRETAEKSIFFPHLGKNCKTGNSMDATIEAKARKAVFLVRKKAFFLNFQ